MKEGEHMSNIAKETKKMNETWVSKQNDLHKTYSNYILAGGLLVVALFIGLLLFMYLK